VWVVLQLLQRHLGFGQLCEHAIALGGQQQQQGAAGCSVAGGAANPAAWWG
jgi:hypothetical protein